MSNQTPYIGSKISLISKLDIRYEGILYTVDTNDSTIALAKVRSFGTEDRPTPNPVAARDDVYEYIIFKASDIKDLIVCETPKVATIGGGLPYDPAIISVSSRSAPGVPHSGSENPHQSAGSSRSGTPHRASPGNLAPGASRAPGAGRGQNRGRGGYQPSNQKQEAGFQHRSGGQFQQRGGYQHYPRGFGHRGNNRTGAPIPREKLKFDSDYDFEKANEQFGDLLEQLNDKLVINDDEEKVESSDKEDSGFYDKKSSFFDRISCEALEKQEGRKGRPDWKKERETNQETFGHNAVRSLNYRRGFGRGMRGGRFNGGQSYGYNRGYSNNYNGGYNQGGYNNQNRGYRRNNYQQRDQKESTAQQ